MRNIFITPIILIFIGCGSKETKVESTAPVAETMKVSLSSAQFKNADIQY